MKRWMSTFSTVLSLGREAAVAVKGARQSSRDAFIMI